MSVILAMEALALLGLGLLVYSTLSVATTPASSCRRLPKLAWLVLVIVVPVVGPIAWLATGRLTASGATEAPAASQQPSRGRSSSPDDDVAFLAQLQARAEGQRRKAALEEERRRREGDAPSP